MVWYESQTLAVMKWLRATAQGGRIMAGIKKKKRRRHVGLPKRGKNDARLLDDDADEGVGRNRPGDADCAVKPPRPPIPQSRH